MGAANTGSEAADPRDDDFARAYSQLCHLLGLTKAGQIEAALDDIVVTTLVIDNDLGAKDESAIADAVFVLFGLKPSNQEVLEAVERLEDRGHLSKSARGYVVDEVVAHAVGERSDEARRLEQAVRDEWIAQLEPPSAELTDWKERAWHGLQDVMADVFRRHGVLTIQLLDGAREAVTAPFSVRVDATAAKVGLTRHDEWFRHALATFFNAQTPQRSTYLAQLLDGTFTFYALTVDQATASFLRKTVSALDLFLDTNFIFAILEFHEDYFARVSREAISLIRDSQLPITLYYHERTLREIDAVMFAIGGRLREHRWSKALSRAAVEYSNATGRLSGLELAYHRLNAETGVDPDTFLTKYEHIEHVLEGEGFKIFREPTQDPSFSLKEKGALIAEYLEYCKEVRPGRPKAYEAADHDMTVWLALRRLRRSSRAALETGALLLSNDFLLYSFDWRRLREQPNAGTVVLPTQLLQLLRPFVPTTDDYDRRFAETFGVPEFRTSHTDYAEATSKVLGILATFEDLPQATATKILRDELLVDRLRTLDERSPEAREAIESVVARDNAMLLEERELLQAQLAEQAATATAALQNQEQIRETSAASVSDLQVQLDNERASRTVETERANRAKAQVRWLVAAIIVVIGMAAIAAVDIPGYGPLAGHPKWLGISILMGVIVAAVGGAVAFPKQRAWVVGAGVIGAFIAIATLI